MKAFSFRLERILRLREQAEQRQARRVGDAIKEEADLERLHREQVSYLEEIGDRLAPEPGQQLSAGWLRVLTLTATAAAQQLEEAARSHATARQVADDERGRLTAARVERKTLERLRERQAEAWQLATRRDERKQDDEDARRRTGGGDAA